MKYLYKKAHFNEEIMEPDDLSIEVVTPTIRGGFILQGENKNFRLLAARLMFQIATFGKARLYCYRQNGALVHTSYVIPKCYKFPFLSKYDYEIGPCFTYPQFRGKGYYPQMLKYICSNIGTEKTVFYMIVDANNIPSIKGIEKAAFQRCGNIKKTKIMKRYKVEQPQKTMMQQVES